MIGEIVEEGIRQIMLSTLEPLGAIIRYCFLRLFGKDVKYKDLRQNKENSGCLNYFVAIVFVGIIIAVAVVLSK